MSTRIHPNNLSSPTYRLPDRAVYFPTIPRSVSSARRERLPTSQRLWSNSICLDAAEGTLDEVAALIRVAIERVAVGAAWSVADDGLGAAREEQAAERIAVIGAVGGERGGGGQQRDQLRRDRRVTTLAGRDGEGDQPAQPVDQGVQFGRGSTTRAAYRVGVSPPFPPAAERCALAQVLSMKPSTPLAKAGGMAAVAASAVAPISRWRRLTAGAWARNMVDLGRKNKHEWTATGGAADIDPFSPTKLRSR